jgi:hypothetical protein
MNKKELKVKSDSKFINDLINDINLENKICRNGLAFIDKYKLKHVKIDNSAGGYKDKEKEEKRLQAVLRNVTKDLLPLEAYHGNVFLIKNNSIAEFYSWFTTESCSIFAKPSTFYKCVVTIHNMDISDIGDFTNADAFIDMDELISYDLDKTLNFMIAMIRNGFLIYKKITH